jgi:hypothetical protein
MESRGYAGRHQEVEIVEVKVAESYCQGRSPWTLYVPLRGVMIR